MGAGSDNPRPSDFAKLTKEKVRFSDTDRLGHVNNTVFARYFESGRVDILYDNGVKRTPEGTFFVAAHTSIDFLLEVNWPSEVVVATKVEKIGRSSVTFSQALFVNDACTTKAKAVIVMMDEETRRSAELPPSLRAFFEALQ